MQTKINFEEMDDVLDDGINIAYIFPDENNDHSWDSLMDLFKSLITKKNEWQEKYPNKRIISILTLMDSKNPVCIQIHYEIIK